MTLIDDLVNPWHINIGPQGKGDGSRFAPYSRNPGLRVRLVADDQMTAPGILDEEFVFPVPPLNEFSRSLTYDWNDYQTIAAGQFSRPTGMALQTCAIDTLLIADDYSWAFYNPKRTRGWDASEQSKQLGRIMRKGTPFRLIVEQAKLNAQPTTAGGVPNSPFPAATAYDFESVPVLSMLASMRSLTARIVSGEPECQYVNVSFVEHRSAALTQKALGKAGASGASGSSIGGAGAGKGGANSSKLPLAIPLGNFAVTPKPAANTLHDLATVYYGSASKWTVIKAANPWLGNVTPDHDLGTWDTSELKAAGKANRRLTLPVASG